MKSFIASIQVVLVTLIICSGGYTALILGIARAVAPDHAAGSLITNTDGRVIGSRLIAQKFTQSQYFWPRPSAVDYNGGGAGGSNKSPTSPDLTARARGIVEQYGATDERPLPPELAAASGGGLDPHITERAARYQAGRIAAARGWDRNIIEDLVTAHAFAPGGALTPVRLVNVLELNLALNATKTP